MPQANIYDQSRISKISKILPQFSEVARPGDTVMMGLEGDPAFPFSGRDRPKATIKAVNRAESGIDVTLGFENGQTKVVNSYSIAPGEVWEYTDPSFANVMERERKAAEMRNRSESQVYRGNSSLEEQVASLKAELAAEREHTRNFHNTYIASLHELANDVCKLDTSGKLAPFCRTFNKEYEHMLNRSEEAVFRGQAEDDSESDDDSDEEDAQKEEEELSEYF